MALLSRRSRSGYLFDMTLPGAELPYVIWPLILLNQWAVPGGMTTKSPALTSCDHRLCAGLRLFESGMLRR